MAADEKQILITSKGHQWLALIGASFVLFEIVFIGFYSNNFWFSLTLAWFGVPTILLVAAVAFGLLTLLEGPFGCRAFWWILRGKPPVVFRRWLTLDRDGFNHGMRHVRFDAIDRLALTLLGNLEIQSRILCGNEQGQPDVVFKFPFAAAAQEEQQKFIDAVKAARPAVEFNERLEKRVKSPIVRGQNMVQMIGAGMMLVLLLDLGYSSFYFLDMLKHYYMANVDGIAGELADAQKELTAADDLRAHPLPFSYITLRFLKEKQSAAGVSAARAEALWHMGRKEDAIAESKREIEFAPESYRSYLHYARYLADSGHVREARGQIQEAIDKKKHSFLPRLYLIASVKEEHPQMAVTSYKQALDDLDEDVFQDEPHWPPGGDAFLADNYFSRDVHFIFDRLIGKRQ